MKENKKTDFKRSIMILIFIAFTFLIFQLMFVGSLSAFKSAFNLSEAEKFLIQCLEAGGLLIVSFGMVTLIKKAGDIPLKIEINTKSILYFLIGCLTGLLIISILFTIRLLNKEVILTNINIAVLQFSSAYLLFYFIVAAGEEFMFRGLLPAVLKIGVNHKKSIVIANIIFVIAHIGKPELDLLGYLNIFLIGIFLSVIYERYNIWMSIGIHTLWNYSLEYIYKIGNNNNLSSVFETIIWESKFREIGMFGIQGGLSTTILVVGLILLTQISKSKISNQAPV